MFAGRWRGVARLSNACCIAVTRWTAVRVCSRIYASAAVTHGGSGSIRCLSLTGFIRRTTLSRNYSTFCFNARPPPPWGRVRLISPLWRRFLARTLDWIRTRRSITLSITEGQRDTYSIVHYLNSSKWCVGFLFPKTLMHRTFFWGFCSKSCRYCLFIYIDFKKETG